MATNLVVTCDVCGGEGARSFTISVDDTRWNVDLCDTDAEPVLLAMGHGRRAQNGSDVRPATQRVLEGRIRGGGAE